MIIQNNSSIGSSLTGIADLDRLMLGTFITSNFKTAVSIRATCKTLHDMADTCSTILVQTSITDRLIEARESFIIKCTVTRHSSSFPRGQDINYCNYYYDILKKNENNTVAILSIAATRLFFTKLINRELDELIDKETEELMKYLNSVPSDIIIHSIPMLNSLLDFIKKQKDKKIASKISEIVTDVEWSYCLDTEGNCSTRNVLYQDEKLTEQIKILTEISKFNNTFTNYAVTALTNASTVITSFIPAWILK